MSNDASTPGGAAHLDADIILAGGGLANGLIAWRLRMRRPELRVLVLEAGDRLGGNHTWSFHDSDLTDDQQAWLAPLVACRWKQHEVVFPGLTRGLDTGYASITGQRFDALLRRDLPGRVRFNTPVASLAPQQVSLESGEVLKAGAVIDGRGVRASPHLCLGFQKFVGRELRLAAPHGLSKHC